MRNTKITIRMLVLFLAAFYPSLCQAEETEEDITVVFDDGETHDIDYIIFDPHNFPGTYIPSVEVEVRDNNSTGQFTTVNLLKYGIIDNRDSLFAYDHSRVNVSGGKISGFLIALDNSQVTCSGGAIEKGLITCNSSRVTISGGTIGMRIRPLWTYDNSRVTISGGKMGDLWVCQNSLVTIFGGKIGELRTSRSNSASCFPGKKGRPRSDWRAHRNPQVTIFGGSIDGTIHVGRGCSEDSVVKFVGSDFAVNGTAVGYGRIDTGGEDRIHGTLTGTLAGGEYLKNKFYIYGDSSILLAPEETLTVDIRPGICPNPLTIKSKGTLSAAILGTEYVNVMDINPDSVRLEGVLPIRSRYKDMATPLVDADDCNCTKRGPDGYLDLSLIFDAQEIAEALGEVSDGEERMLILTAELTDGTPVTGTDWVLIYNSSRPFH